MSDGAVGRFLAPLGLTGEQESAYARLLRGQPVALSPEDELALVDNGLADRVDGRLRARSPALAAERWVADRTFEIAQVREGVEHYASLRSREQGTFVEVVRGIDQVRIAAQQLQESATVLVRGFDREPYFSDEIIVDPAQSPAIDRGISYQVVYRQSALSDPRVLKTVRAAVEMGRRRDPRPTCRHGCRSSTTPSRCWCSRCAATPTRSTDSWSSAHRCWTH